MSDMNRHFIPDGPTEKTSVTNVSEPSKDDDDLSSTKQDGAAKRDLEEEVTLTFPQRLMEILDNEENADIITWLPHGQGFMIYKKKAFEINVMSRYFKQSKFTSFTRKLNRWGFTRVTRGPETGAYYHKFFKRGQPRLCLQMSCQSSKGQQDAWMKQQQAGMVGVAAPQLNPLLMPPLNPAAAAAASMSSLVGATAAAGGNALLQQQLLQLQQQQALQQLQQQELIRRAMASQTSNSLYLQLLQGKAGGGNFGSDQMLMAQLQSAARAAVTGGVPIDFNNTSAAAMATLADQGNSNEAVSPDSNRSVPAAAASAAGGIRRASAA